MTANAVMIARRTQSPTTSRRGSASTARSANSRLTPAVSPPPWLLPAQLHAQRRRERAAPAHAARAPQAIAGQQRGCRLAQLRACRVLAEAAVQATAEVQVVIGGPAG